MQFTPVTVSGTYQQVVQQIEDKIRSGQLVSGNKLPPERDLAQLLGVSRGSVRDALKVLAAIGVVEARQGSGIYVRNDPTPTISRVLTLSVAPVDDSLRGLFEFREPLEVLSAQLAAQHRTEEQLTIARRAVQDGAAAAEAGDPVTFNACDKQFHVAVAVASGNPYLPVVLGAVMPLLQDVALLIAEESGSMELAVAQHTQVATAIAAGSPDEAARAMREHVAYSATSLHEAWEAARSGRGRAG